MDYYNLAYWHLGTVLPAFLIGAYLLANNKGTPIHRLLGKVYMCLLLVTAVISLFMPAVVGPSFLSHFGFIHLLSFLVLYSVPTAYLAARNGNIRKHKAHMIWMYILGILVAGGFALLPGRLLYKSLIG